MDTEVEMEDHFVHKRFRKEMSKRSKSPQLSLSSDEGNSEEEDNHEHNLSARIKDKFDHFVGRVKKAPKWLRDNKYIRSGYRVNFNTPKKVLKR